MKYKLLTSISFSLLSLTVKAQETLSTVTQRGNTTYANILINASGDAIKIGPGTANHAYISFFPRTATPTVRGAYMGFPYDGATRFNIVNEAAGVIGLGNRILINNAPDDGSTALLVNGGIKTSAGLFVNAQHGTIIKENNGAYLTENILTTGWDPVQAQDWTELGVAGGAVNTAQLRLMGNGNVGICTTDTKGYKLAVNGSAIFTKVKVKIYSAWPDFVFSNEYKLPSLASVEKYIEEHKRLPALPSAKDVENNGLDLGEMNKLLLQKVEELTLYIIQQQKEISILNEKMKKVEQR